MVEDCVSGVLPYPSLLSTPVTLTLALSRRVGEGKHVAALHGFALVSLSKKGRVSFDQPHRREGLKHVPTYARLVHPWIPAFAGMT